MTDRGNAPVFVSYARGASRRQAEALTLALGEIAFLDSNDIALGEAIPAGVVDAVLAAKVMVVFAEPVYFTRWYCLRELNVALAAFNALVRRGEPEEERAAALRPLVVALGPTVGTELERLPAGVRTRNWPLAGDTESLAALVIECLHAVDETFAERLDRLGQADVVRATVLTEAAAPPPRNRAGLPCFALAGELRPSIGGAFVGRADELWRIHHELDTLRGGSSGAALTGALEAAGGFGKTRLATEYLHRFGPVFYPGGLFWVNASATERLDEQFHGILAALGADVPTLVAFRQAGRDARGELSDALHRLDPTRPVLYVVDNLPEPEPGQAPAALEHWCPAIGEVALLVTSRATQSVSPEVRPLPVDVLDVDAAVHMLTRDYSGRNRLDDEAWAHVARWVGRLPLALELLNAALRYGVLDPQELIDGASRPGALGALDESAQVLRGFVPLGQLPGISGSMSISYDCLDADAQAGARLVAQLANTPVPLALFEAFGPSVATKAVRANLVGRSLVIRVPSQTPPMLGTMHPVIAEFLRGQGDEDDLVRAGAVLSDVISPAASRDPTTWPLMRACLPHARWVFDRSRTADSISTRTAAIRLGQCINIMLLAQGLAAEALEISEAGLATATAALGTEHPATLTSANNLAAIRRALGDAEGARRLNEEVYEGHRRLLGPEHSATLTSANNLAATLWTLGDAEGALLLLQEIYEARRRLLGPEHPDTLGSANNLAETIYDLGDVEGARRLHAEVYEARRRLLGPEHLGTLTSANNLAATRRSVGDAEGARRLHEEVYAAYRRLLGPEHPDTLISANNLAQTRLALGDAEGARGLHEDLHEARRRLLGPHHPDTLNSANNLAVTLYELGDAEGARHIFQEVYAARVRVLGPEHPDTLGSANNLAATLYDLGDAEGARRLHEQVYEAYRRLLGPRHPDTLNSANDLAETLDALGDAEGARRLLEATHEARRPD